ncbi:hypothetical protein [Meiothermus hypogaeus]|uniref:Lipoprotein n=2 Tax=Meiothermus hypogaeus TaxID=884155 RepID=A0A511R0Q1_9DEIN|nr:hypothetical protein [Meiothermus hypogaeus]RIH76832.1 hypothetical protein Mhypo_02257 [Meiothermus hypogaeus]GEM83188.1 hypothetical protein MHY01S_13540 [Meiothermus hypogaeus NBRC 106114]
MAYRINQYTLWTLLCWVLLLSACNQTAPDQTRHSLQTVNGKTLPALLLDTVLQDPDTPPYRFRVFVTEGWFRLDGNRYEQQVRFYELAEGYPSHRFQWSEYGTCQPSGEGLRCQSAYIQNYTFELTRQGDQLVTRQQFGDPNLVGTYVFSR